MKAGLGTHARTHFAKALCLSPPEGARGRAPGLGMGGRHVPPPLLCPSGPSSPFWAPPGSDGSGRDREHRPLRGRLRSPRDPRPVLPARSCSLRAPLVSDPQLRLWPPSLRPRSPRACPGSGSFPYSPKTLSSHPRQCRGSLSSPQPLRKPLYLPHCPDPRAMEPAAAHPAQKQRDTADHGGRPTGRPDHLGGEERRRGPGETGPPGMPAAAFSHAPAGAAREA